MDCQLAHLTMHCSRVVQEVDCTELSPVLHHRVVVGIVVDLVGDLAVAFAVVVGTIELVARRSIAVEGGQEIGATAHTNTVAVLCSCSSPSLPPPRDCGLPFCDRICCSY